MNFNVDSEIKRLEREIFRLDKERSQIKKDIWFHNASKRSLERATDIASKRRFLQISKELYILNSNYDLKTEEIVRRIKRINNLKEEKNRSHHGMKRLRTRERHYQENMALVGEFEWKWEFLKKIKGFYLQIYKNML